MLRRVSTHLHWSLADCAGHGERVDEGRSASSPGCYGRMLSPVVMGLDRLLVARCWTVSSDGAPRRQVRWVLDLDYSRLPMGRRYGDCPSADRWIYPPIWCSMAI
ncbi:hypothetical protein ACLOJK_027064 [Asimina triloba]